MQKGEHWKIDMQRYIVVNICSNNLVLIDIN